MVKLQTWRFIASNEPRFYNKAIYTFFRQTLLLRKNIDIFYSILCFPIFINNSELVIDAKSFLFTLVNFSISLYYLYGT